MVYDRLKCTWASALPLLRSVPAYGQPATAEEVMEAGNSCAICQVCRLNRSTASRPGRIMSCCMSRCVGCLYAWRRQARRLQYAAC